MLLGGGLPKKPCLEWMAGLILRWATFGPWDNKKILRVRFFERVGCRWTPLPDDRAAAERARLGNGLTSAAPVWVCQDCSSVRIDLIDADGRDYMVVGDLPEGPEPRLYGGLFLTFAKAPTLASDTPVTSSPSRV